MDCSLPLVARVNRRRPDIRAIYAKLPDDAKAARFVPKMLLIHGNVMKFPIRVLSMIIITRSVGTIGNVYANF